MWKHRVYSAGAVTLLLGLSVALLVLGQPKIVDTVAEDTICFMVERATKTFVADIENWALEGYLREHGKLLDKDTPLLTNERAPFTLVAHMGRKALQGYVRERGLLLDVAKGTRVAVGIETGKASSVFIRSGPYSGQVCWIATGLLR